MKRTLLAILIGISFIRAQTVLRQATFRFQPVISGIQKVFLAGTFNDWSGESTPMLDEDGDGVFTVTLLLRSGVYQYKFVVDGVWMTDPEAGTYADEGRDQPNALITVREDDVPACFVKGDGLIYTDGLTQSLDYFLLNPIEHGMEFHTRVYYHDVESVSLLFLENGKCKTIYFSATDQDGIFQYYHAFIEMNPEEPLDFLIRFQDGDSVLYSGRNGLYSQFPETEAWFHYTSCMLPRYTVPNWVQDGIFYQIFPDRFCNGDTSNDPDFSEFYYTGKTKLPSSGKTDSEYFHLVRYWNDITGLKASPFRTDGKPDYFSFYGGDIQGVMNHLDYLKDLGVTILYFNPLNQGKSNHKYDPVDYLSIDPHFGDEVVFKKFVSEAHKRDIRIIVDMAFNHTGDSHFAFVDSREKGPESRYWNWYEWHKWPLPEGGCPTPCFYYDCWWDFPLHPNLNYDLSRPNAEENDIHNAYEAEPNEQVVQYVLDAARYWLGNLDIDGFRLDVPNEVPFWFWSEFREVAESAKSDAFLIGEIWGNAMPWLGPGSFHSTMNYKYFRDPVLAFIGKGQGSAEAFDQILTTGRNLYPLQASLSMMNLIGSHDTERFIQQADGNIKRVMLAVLFSMTYPGVPHIYYGDEIGLEGGKDPDNRRPFPWDWENSVKRRQIHDFVRKAAGIRHEFSALRAGLFKTLHTQGMNYAYMRKDAKARFLIVIHNDEIPGTVRVSLRNSGLKNNTRFTDLLSLKEFKAVSDTICIRFDGLDGVILKAQ